MAEIKEAKVPLEVTVVCENCLGELEIAEVDAPDYGILIILVKIPNHVCKEG